MRQPPTGVQSARAKVVVQRRRPPRPRGHASNPAPAKKTVRQKTPMWRVGACALPAKGRRRWGAGEEARTTRLYAPRAGNDGAQTARCAASATLSCAVMTSSTRPGAIGARARSNLSNGNGACTAPSKGAGLRCQQLATRTGRGHVLRRKGRKGCCRRRTRAGLVRASWRIGGR